MSAHLGTVFVVEDDPNDVMLFKRAFRKAALANPVYFSGDGEAAIGYLDGLPPFCNRETYPLPQLILLDLKLPRKSGFEVLQWVRARTYLNGIAIVILTSSDRESDIQRAYEFGANSYLVKPVETDVLVEMVKVTVRYWSNWNRSPSADSKKRGSERSCGKLPAPHSRRISQ